jgi:methylase of polypeptide subunit release factors
MDQPFNTPEEDVLLLQGVGKTYVPREYARLLPPSSGPTIIPASARPDHVLQRLSQGEALVVTEGDWEDLRILIWYVMKFKGRLVPRPTRKPTATEGRKRQGEIRDAVHRLFVVVRDGGLVGISDHPDLREISLWVSWEIEKDRAYLVPMRNISRILTDMRRSREGIQIGALGGGRIVVLPQVYVPFDQSVVNLLNDHICLGRNETVLDLGTGTGVLAFVAALKGPRKVIATDLLPSAVANARLNAQSLGLEELVEVRDPGDLFEPAPERFDVIIFNPPWILGSPRTVYDRAIYDPGGETVLNFLNQVRDHLKPGGRAYLLYSDLSERTGEGSISRVREAISSNGLVIGNDWHTTRRSRAFGIRERVHLLEIIRHPQAAATE